MNEDLKKYHEVIAAAWHFMKMYLPEANNTDDFWEEAVAVATTVCKRLGNTDFANAIFGSILLEIDRQVMAGRR